MMRFNKFLVPAAFLRYIQSYPSVMKKPIATITMSRTTLSRLRAVAAHQKRTLSQQLEFLAERHCARQEARRHAAAVTPATPVPAPEPAIP
jgi:4'-phosphopantetheinyl transferase EntD